MKQLLLSLAAMMLVVASPVGAMAHDSKVYIPDFSIKKGETKTISIMLDNPGYSPTSIQFDIYFSGGIVPVEKTPGRVAFTRKYRVPEDGFSGAGSWQNNHEYYRYLFYNMEGLPIEDNSGAIFTFKVTTDETFDPQSKTAAITIKNTRMSDLDDTSTSYKAPETQTDVCTALDFTDMFTAGNEGQKCFLKDGNYIAAIWTDKDGTSYAFATNGNGQWLKLVFPNGKNPLIEESTYMEGEFGGIVTDATLNPTIVIENPGEYTPANSDIFPSMQAINLQDHQANVELSPNEVVDITGFFFVNDEGKTCLSEWSGLNGSRGTVVEINTAMCPDVDFASTQALNGGNPVQYHFSRAVAQRKATAVNSPAKVASTEATPYDGYVIYPIYDQYEGNIVTAVDSIESSSPVTSIRYVNVAGMESSTPFDGMNIVVKTHADGTTSTSKLIK